MNTVTLTPFQKTELREVGRNLFVAGVLAVGLEKKEKIWKGAIITAAGAYLWSVGYERDH